MSNTNENFVILKRRFDSSVKVFDFILSISCKVNSVHNFHDAILLFFLRSLRMYYAPSGARK